MSEAIKNFLKATKEMKAKKAPQDSDLMALMMGALGAVTGALNIAQIQEVNKLLQKVKQLLMLKEVAAFKPSLGSLEKPQFSSASGTAVQEPNQTREAMLLGLEKLTTSKMCPVLKKRIFLLHRPTVNFEYDQGKRDSEVKTPYPTDTSLPDSSSIAQRVTENTVEYETDEDTNWLIDPVVAEKLRAGKNPIVAVWVPETEIKDVDGSQQGAGAWGELGANSDKNIITVVIKPGKYKIYSELKA